MLRQDDSTTAWTDAPGTLNRRIDPLQGLLPGWRRADVVAVYDVNEGLVAERVRYSAYGVPFCIAAADFDADGDVDGADNTAYSNASTAGDPSADLNLDSVVDFNDTLAWNNLFNAGETGGHGVLCRNSSLEAAALGVHAWRQRVIAVMNASMTSPGCLPQPIVAQSAARRG